MDDKHIESGERRVNSDLKTSPQLIQAAVQRINEMTSLLYEIKAGTPLGKILVVLINLCPPVRDGRSTEKTDFTGVPVSGLAELAGVTEKELRESLICLQQQGIIFYRPLFSVEIKIGYFGKFVRFIVKQLTD